MRSNHHGAGFPVLPCPRGGGPALGTRGLAAGRPRAAETANRHIRGYLVSLMQHYELLGEHFANTEGYAEYGETAKFLADAGQENMADDYLAAQTWGTPEQILEKIRARRDVVGDYDALLCMRFSGTPWEVTERSIRSFGEHVIPELRRWKTAETIAA